MTMGAVVKLLLSVVFAIISAGGAAEVRQHVVGDDQGWDVSSDIASWSSTRIFKVGDLIWFGYQAPQESVVELQSKDEYASCDVSNPIMMLTDGLNKISLEREGIRYFASGNHGSCISGLKLHVEVQSQELDETEAVGSSTSRSQMLDATGPTPSMSAHLNGLSFMLFVGALILCLLFSNY